jgi:hypothetical protein
MRGGMGRFLARSQAPAQAGNEERRPRGKGKEREVEVVEDSEEEDSVPSPRKVPPPAEAVAELHVPEDTEKPTTKGPEPPEPPDIGPSNPTTPVKRPPLAPVFTKSPAPAAHHPQPDPAAEPGSPYPRNAPPPTTDQRAFERAHAMGWYATRTENPDAKRLMKSAEWREQHTAANEGFLEGYYQNSRCVRLEALEFGH